MNQGGRSRLTLKLAESESLNVETTPPPVLVLAGKVNRVTAELVTTSQKNLRFSPQMREGVLKIQIMVFYDNNVDVDADAGNQWFENSSSPKDDCDADARISMTPMPFFTHESAMILGVLR